MRTLASRRLAEYNTSIDRIHSTRLKEDILKELPDVSETRHGKDVLLLQVKMLEPSKDVGAIFDARTFSSQNDGACLAKAADTIRKQLFSDHLQSDAFLENFEENTKKKYETAFPLYLGLMLHSKTRKKELVTDLASYGMSVSYDRVREVELSITKHLCKMYQELEVVCTPTLRKGLFTTAAIDNIDHNPSSATATEAFHGTSISIFQHPEQEHSQEVPLFDTGIEKLDVPLELPQSYSTIFPAKTVPSEYPLQ